MLFFLACATPPEDDAPDLASADYDNPEAVEEEEEGAPTNGQEADPGTPLQTDSVAPGSSSYEAPYAVHTGESETQTWCRTLLNMRGQVALIVVDMDTGAWVEEDRWSGFHREGTHTAGLATDGTTWVFTGYEDARATWYAVDAATGTVTNGGNAALTQLSVGWSGTEWVVVDPYMDRVERYATFADLGAGAPAASVEAGRSSRLTVDGAEVYSSWHSDNQVDVYDLTTGALLRHLPLEGWDTWVWGMSVAGGKLHLIDDARQRPDPEYLISAFDPATGAWMETVALGNMPGRPSGLWCGTTAP